MLLPSIKRTLRKSSSTSTSATLSSADNAKIPIPFLQKQKSIIFNNSFDNSQFPAVKTKITRKADRLQPKFCGKSFTVNVNMRRFVRLVAIKIKAVGLVSQNLRHILFFRFKFLEFLPSKNHSLDKSPDRSNRKNP